MFTWHSLGIHLAWGEGGPYQSSPQKGPCASHRIGSIGSHRQLAIARSCPLSAVCLVCRGCQQFWDEAKFASGAPTDHPLCIYLPSSPLIIAFVCDMYLLIYDPSHHTLGAAYPRGGFEARRCASQGDKKTRRTWTRADVDNVDGEWII